MDAGFEYGVQDTMCLGMNRQVQMRPLCLY